MRQFVVSTMPNKKGRIALTEKERRYLINVLRLKNDAIIEVSLPDGSLREMSLRLAEKKTGIVELVSLRIENAESSLEALKNDNGVEYWLFQFLPKGQKMDLIVRQASECGVTAIVPIHGDFSIGGKVRDSASENAHKVERWMRIVREARQQSGSRVNTKIFLPCSITEAMLLWHENIEKKQKESLGLVLCEKHDNQESMFTIASKRKSFLNTCIGFAVGCEGGISPSEIDILQKNMFQPIHFNTNVLRAETAALYGIASLQVVIEEYNIWKGLRG